MQIYVHKYAIKRWYRIVLGEDEHMSYGKERLLICSFEHSNFNDTSIFLVEVVNGIANSTDPPTNIIESCIILKLFGKSSSSLVLMIGQTSNVGDSSNN